MACVLFQSFNLASSGLTPTMSCRRDGQSGQKPGWSRSARRFGNTSEEDFAILNFVSKRKSETRGILLWLELEKRGLINRSCRSTKVCYQKHLCVSLLQNQRRGGHRVRQVEDLGLGQGWGLLRSGSGTRGSTRGVRVRQVEDLGLVLGLGPIGDC